MPKPLHELREQLLRAGVAPRHVRRYLGELTDHLSDLRTEEVRAGRSTRDAESAALARLGSMDELAKAMIEQRHFQSWCARAPWATFGLAPVVFLAAAWSVALFILWSGWQIFLPGAATPFGAGHYRIFDLANVYFQVGRSIYIGSPILVGWGIGLVAARQRMKAVWPGVGLLMIAVIGGAGQAHGSLPGVIYHGCRGVMPQASYPYGLVHAAILLTITALPYLIRKLQQAWRSA